MADTLADAAAQHQEYPRERSAWRKRLYVVIFEADTRAGQAFDVLLITAILASVGAVMLESVEAVDSQYGRTLRVAEWIFTILFTVEYALRLLCAPSARRYATSFFGVVDFLAIMPTYVSAIVPGAQFLLVVRLLRVLRVFRVLKLVAYLGEANFLLRALRESRKKITVFLFAVLTMVTIFGTLIYLVEGPENGFTSIPRAIYWAIVTLTTVGFGDIAPQTTLGQFLAAVLMISGFGIIAVPTGIVTSEMMNSSAKAGDEDGQDVQRKAHREAEHDTGEAIDRDDDASATGGAGEEPSPPADARSDSNAASNNAGDGNAQAVEEPRCPACALAGHDGDAVFCKRCGTRLAPQETSQEQPAT